MHPYGTQADFTSEVMPRGWYAAYTRHQHEKSVSQILRNKGFEVLLPLHSSQNRWKDRVQTVHVPLFPCYVFIEADLRQRTEILKTPGVCWLVGTAGVPSPLPSHDIASVRRLADHPALLEPHEPVSQGDRVRILAGPFYGLEGILIKIKNKSRVVVTVELLQKSAAVEVSLSLLERVFVPQPYGIAQFVESSCT